MATNGTISYGLYGLDGEIETEKNFHLASHEQFERIFAFGNFIDAGRDYKLLIFVDYQATVFSVNDQEYMQYYDFFAEPQEHIHFKFTLMRTTASTPGTPALIRCHQPSWPGAEPEGTMFLWWAAGSRCSASWAMPSTVTLATEETESAIRPMWDTPSQPPTVYQDILISDLIPRIELSRDYCLRGYFLLVTVCFFLCFPNETSR